MTYFHYDASHNLFHCSLLVVRLDTITLFALILNMLGLQFHYRVFRMDFFSSILLYVVVRTGQIFFNENKKQL